MRKIFESGISIIVALISLGLCIKWYRVSHEIEPLIGIVASAGVLVTWVVYRFFPERSVGVASSHPNTAAPDIEHAITIENSKNVVVGSNITAGGNVTIGDQTNNTTVNNEGAEIKNQFNGGTFKDTTFN